jgi:hypothetical protein
MPADLVAGLGVTSAGTLGRGLVTTALIGVGDGVLSSLAAFVESSGRIADEVAAAVCLPAEEFDGLAGLPGEGLELLLSDFVVTSEEAPLAGCADFLPME